MQAAAMWEFPYAGMLSSIYTRNKVTVKRTFKSSKSLFIELTVTVAQGTGRLSSIWYCFSQRNLSSVCLQQLSSTSMI